MNNPLPLLHKHLEGQDIVSLQQSLLRSLLVMAWAVEARDPYTGGHLWRVSQLARILAEVAGLKDTEIARVVVGGFLHDLGKIAVPDSILTKSERLTEDEFGVIRTHPDAGWRLIKDHPLAELVEASIRSHHETPDGRGYPEGLSEHEIPVVAKIVGICDAFDAMTSTRPYRKGMPIEKALSIIENNLGTQFDLAFGTLFIAQGKAGVFDHIVSHSDHGIPLLTCGVCGPVIVRQRNQIAGEHVYCRSCAGDYVLETDESNKAVARFTGNLVAANQLTPQADTSVIDDLIKQFMEMN